MHLPLHLLDLALAPTSLVLTLVLVLIGRWLASLVHHFFFDTLRHVPTYIPGVLFPWWNVVGMLNGRGYAIKEHLHRKMGKGIVRFARNEIDVCDPDAVHQILRIDDEPKHKESYDGGKFFRDEPDVDLVLVTDLDKHKKLRRMFSPGFSIKYLSNLEPLMSGVYKNFETVIKAKTISAKSAPIVDIAESFHNIAADVIGEAAFGQSFDMVNSSNHPYQNAIKSILRLFTLRFAFPFVSDDLLGFTKHQKIHADHVKKCVQKRLDLIQDGHARDDILQTILDHRDPNTKEPLTSDEIAVHVKLFLLAGSETTANTMAWTILFLLKNPKALDRLRSELDATFPNGMSEQLSLAKLKSLPWLDACVKEALRLKPILTAMSRTARDDFDLPVKGHDGKVRTYHIPKNTVIRTNVYATQRNPSVWLQADEYLPERWLADSTLAKEEEAFTYGNTARVDDPVHPRREDEKGPVMLNQRAFFPFSMGSRDCLGRNFAWNEMRIVLGHLIRRYNIIPQFDVREVIEGRERGTLTIERKGGMPVRLEWRG